MAVIKTTIRAFFDDGYYRNNTVEMQIPDEAAEIIRKAWTAPDGPTAQRNAIRSVYLSRNQSADAQLFMSGDLENAVAGFRYMTSHKPVSNEIITRDFTDEEDA